MRVLSAVQFDSGFAHGMGQYTSVKGRVYRGEWTSGLRHGWAGLGARLWAGGLGETGRRSGSDPRQRRMCRHPALTGGVSWCLLRNNASAWRGGQPVPAAGWPAFSRAAIRLRPPALQVRRGV